MAEAGTISARERFARPLFIGTIVIGSFLLFLTQPMIARMALPRVGGAPALWNSAMVVYQALLLGGYAYAHWAARLSPRRQAGLHLALFALAGLWLPIGLRNGALPPAADPVLWVPWLLIASIGPLFFIVAAQAPLMQRWYALESARGDPYALYAASNLGSFAGLISYPLIVEPLLSLEQQSRLWTAGYALLVAGVASCALTIPPGAILSKPVAGSPKPARRTILHWIALAAVPSGLMLSTTTHLTTDIVAIPLLWVVPLGLYLLSFVIAFSEGRGPSPAILRLVPLVILIGGGFAFFEGSAEHPLLAAGLGLCLLIVVAVNLHGALYRLRPAAEHLTAFYLAIAVGGMIGGIFCAIISPVIFDWTYEHPLLILAAAGLTPQSPLLPVLGRLWRSAAGKWISLGAPVVTVLASLVGSGRMSIVPRGAEIAAGVLIVVLAIISIGRKPVFMICLAALMLCFGGWWVLDVSLRWHSRTRSYFGVYSVTSNDGGTARVLTHGTTLHGMQSVDPAYRLEPTTYYTRRSGVGLAMRSAGMLYGPHARIGVVGLGTGTLSCYALPGQSWTFFEIDPAVVEIALRSRHFTFLPSCVPGAKIAIGDARLRLSKVPAGHLDLLAMDAFSSDAVPMHLLTREAFDVYARALQPRGLLLVHVSNRYVDLVPVVAAAAASGGWHAAKLDYHPSEREAAHFATASVWIALSRNQSALDGLIVASAREGTWEPLPARPDFSLWTDDHASILPLLKPLTGKFFGIED